MAGKENRIQTALMLALQSYCDAATGIELRQFPPYANQQGGSLRKYCADLVGMLDDSTILLLEIKELDCDECVLPEFNTSQHNELLRFEQIGVPIAYAYNTQDLLEYDRKNRSAHWPSLTLAAIKRSKPSLLPCEWPMIDEHETMLNWIQNVGSGGSGDSTELFGRIAEVVNAPDDLRNGLLALIYGVEQQVLTSLTADQFDKVMRLLNNPNLTPIRQSKLQRILGEHARVFDQFSAVTDTGSILNANTIGNPDTDTPGMDGP